ncbi:MAG: NUDIX domain-containing protein [Patescibacteria group bacterium]|nr:NUDIX domain-containing protein [Patescibacteria group bacterium]
MSKYQLFRLVVAAVIHDNEGRFLIAQRHLKDSHQPGVWAIPAGHVETGESSVDILEENLRREVKEEIGIEINIENFLDSHSWVDTDYKKVTVVFLCTIKSGEPKALSETNEVRWVTIDKISELNLAPHISRLIGKANERLGLK